MASKKKQKYFKQSGVVPVYEGKIVLVTARGSDRWIVPKGMIGWNLTAIESAAKEALEEAGAKGIVHPEAIGTYTYEKMGGRYKVKLYLMEVTKLKKDWEEKAFRKRKLMTPKQAIKKMVPAAVSKILAVYFQENWHLIKQAKPKSRKKKMKKS